MDQINDEYYMGLALDMAERAQGQTGINPVVGAVVVKDGALIGLGTHLKRGTPHAEVHALNMAGSDAEGSTVYVTLEPCSHFGLTPPCSERLIRDKVARVVVACEDPNPQVAGRGIEMIRRSGIEVKVGVLQDRALKLNRKFIKYISTGLPFVTIKTASTLDGKIATRSGDSKWISNADAREMVHTMRHRHQGIMVGVSTIVSDDPQLTTRLPIPGLSPVRIIVDSSLRIPLKSKVLHDGLAPTIILAAENYDPEKADKLTELGAKVILCEGKTEVNLKDAMTKLGEQGISSILVEGGGHLNGSLLKSRLVDEIVLFFAPKIIGGPGAVDNFIFDGFDEMKDAVFLSDMEVEPIGDNICIKGSPVWS